MKSISQHKSLLRRVRNAEHFQFHWWIKDLLNEHDDELSALAPIITRYLAVFDREDEIFKHDRSMQGTMQIRELDRLRDDMLIALRKAIESAMRSLTPATKLAAQQLNHLMAVYRNSNKKPYIEATAEITNLVQDLRKTGYASLVTTLSLTEMVNQLDTQNQAFDTAFKQRSRWLMDQALLGKMYTIRPEVDAVFDELAEAITALYQGNEFLTKDASIRVSLGGVIDSINGFISETERAHNNSVTPTEPDDPDPEPTPPFEFMAKSQTRVNDQQMRVEAPDPEAFAAALFPIALGATLTTREGDYPNIFTVTGFTRNAEDTPDGLLLNCGEHQSFMADLIGGAIDPCPLLQEDKALAIIAGLIDPDMLMV